MLTAKTESVRPPSKNKHMHFARNFFKKSILPHIELIAALLSGAIILLTWLLADHLTSQIWITLHLLAFIIGGYAKAKEGIQETIANKELNVEMLMIFAAIGSAIIGYWTEGAILIFIFALSGALETYTMNKSNKEISALMNLQPEQATLIEGKDEKIVPVSKLKVNDRIQVRAGERIPADGVILNGSTAIDESAISGESIPINKKLNDDVFAGTVSLDGTIQVEITKPSHETMFQKIIQLVQSAQEEKSPSQLFIEKFEGTYVKVVLLVVTVMMFLPYLVFGWSLSESIYRAMILLVVASPCALVASIMPATLSAISNSAKKGVLFKGGVHIENLSHVKAVAFDKTGTLTKGKLVVTDVHLKDTLHQEDILVAVEAIEKQSTHPLAKALTTYCQERVNHKQSPNVEAMKTIGGNGVKATLQQHEWKIGKAEFVGEEEAKEFQGGILNTLASQGKSVIFVQKDNEIVAAFALKDTIREETKHAIRLLRKNGIHTIMLTGDNELTAKAIATEAGIDDYIANCLPKEKVTHIKQLKKQYKNVAMVGDGINDAPALATANLGIAMGEGTDVALETSDVVLMKNNLDKITNAIKLSKRMNQIVKQNIYFSLSVIVVLIFTNFFQVIDLPLGVIGHEGSTILVILNGLRLLR